MNITILIDAAMRQWDVDLKINISRFLSRCLGINSLPNFIIENGNKRSEFNRSIFKF